MQHQGLLDEAQALLESTIELRRHIHAHPELGLVLPKTQAAVLGALEGLGLDISIGTATSSVVAVLEGGSSGPTTLLRGDMDALPMTEDTGLEFASHVEGAMHACGHDAHTAMLVGAARLLVERREDLAGRVVLMFQPGEEGFAGARAMLHEGLLERYGPIDRAFAIHITPLIPPGMVAGRVGALMASADSFEAVITGRGGHASMPHDAVDPVPVACEVVTALQSMVTRRIPVFDPAVVTVGSIQAGTTDNVIPERAVLELTIRAVSESSRQLAIEGMHRVVDHIASAHLCLSTVRTTQPGYPVTVNDALAADHALGVARQLLGEDHVVCLPNPVMAAEDWSFVLEMVPGSMLFLGAAPSGIADPPPNHSNRMLIDESAMAAGIALHAAVALSPLEDPQLPDGRAPSHPT
jgi:hippurate hydrolase